MNVLHYIKHPNRIFVRLKLANPSKLSDEEFIKLSYYNILGRWPDLKNPTRYTEKSQWFKLNCRDVSRAKYIDKLAVRDIISEKIGDEYLIPILGAWKSFDEIDFDALPNQFVLKCNHDSHSAIICKDKSKFNLEKAREKLTKALGKSFYTNSREWLYDQIVPCIIAEKFMEDSNHELRDYKFWCFNGVVKFVNVFTDRDSNLKIATLTRDWKPAGFLNNTYPPVTGELRKPENYDLMIELAEKLSCEFSHVRMDFYNIDGKIYFGEYTFTPASGFQRFVPDEYDKIVGDYWKIP